MYSLTKILAEKQQQQRNKQQHICRRKLKHLQKNSSNILTRSRIVPLKGKQQHTGDQHMSRKSCRLTGRKTQGGRGGGREREKKKQKQRSTDEERSGEGGPHTCRVKREN